MNRDVDCSHVFPLEPLFRRLPWLPFVLLLVLFGLAGQLDLETLESLK